MHSLLISSLRAAVESGEKKEQGKKKKSYPEDYLRH